MEEKVDNKAPRTIVYVLDRNGKEEPIIAQPKLTMDTKTPLFVLVDKVKYAHKIVWLYRLVVVIVQHILYMQTRTHIWSANIHTFRKAPAPAKS